MSRTIDVERLRKLCAKNLDALQIAARLGVKPGSVRDACKKHGISLTAAPQGQTNVSWFDPA